MANKDRQKRSVRKARAAERKSLEERRASSVPADPKKAKAVSQKAAAVKKAEPKKKGRLATWFGDVRAEMRRVTWPNKQELKDYASAVIVMLIVFGVVISLFDTGVVAALTGFAGLRG